MMNERRQKTSTVRAWHQDVFRPWQEQMQRYRAEEQNQIVAVRNQKYRIQFLVGLVLNGEHTRAVKGWNALGLRPELREIRTDKTREELLFVTRQNQVIQLDMNSLITELQGILAETRAEV